MLRYCFHASLSWLFLTWFGNFFTAPRLAKKRRQGVPQLDLRNTYDAIVAGAGPAGSTAAYLLAANGLKVLLLDKHRFPRNKLCGGLLTWKTVHLLEQIYRTPLDFLRSQKIIVSQSLKYRVASTQGEFIHNRLEYPFHFVERKSYDFFWLEKAQAAGAEFRPGEKLMHLEISRNQIATNQGHKFRGTFIIGADGVFSRIRWILDNETNARARWRSGLATAFAAVISSLEFPHLPADPIIHFGLIPWGYAWCFPREDVRFLGLCGLNIKAGKHLRRGFQELMCALQVSSKQKPPLKSYALPYGNYLIHPGRRNILLIGDAGGLADPLLGEGIYYAHKSAQLAAEAVLASSRSPESAAGKYTHLMQPSVLTELKFAKIGRNIIFSLPGNWPARVMMALLRRSPQTCENTVQGLRSFKWLRPLDGQLSASPRRP
jgi:menaquinone-9 beta-reductase